MHLTVAATTRMILQGSHVYPSKMFAESSLSEEWCLLTSRSNIVLRISRSRWPSPRHFLPPPRGLGHRHRQGFLAAEPLRHRQLRDPATVGPAFAVERPYAQQQPRAHFSRSQPTTSHVLLVAPFSMRWQGRAAEEVRPRTGELRGAEDCLRTDRRATAEQFTAWCWTDPLRSESQPRGTRSKSRSGQLGRRPQRRRRTPL